MNLITSHVTIQSGDQFVFVSDEPGDYLLISAAQDKSKIIVCAIEKATDRILLGVFNDQESLNRYIDSHPVDIIYKKCKE